MKIIASLLNAIAIVIIFSWNFFVRTFKNKTYSLWELWTFALLSGLDLTHVINGLAWLGFWALAIVIGKTIAHFTSEIKLLP